MNEMQITILAATVIVFLTVGYWLGRNARLRMRVVQAKKTEPDAYARIHDPVRGTTIIDVATLNETGISSKSQRKARLRRAQAVRRRDYKRVA